jgi:two-component system sensor kinase FixL
MNQIITELTEYTKSLNLRKTEQDIQQVLEEALSALREIIDQYHIQIFKHFPYYQISISADAILLTQAIQNIIHNALQVMTSGGELHVTVQPSSLKAEYVHIAIQDTGPGLDTGKLEKIFRPFYTTKDKGTGLGLSLCHRIIEAHQGFIWAAQNKSRGLTFNILLPR